MAGENSSKPWLAHYTPAPQANWRLFCFPYAGGGSSVFRTWPQRLPRFVEVCPVQLPGRGTRIAEPPFTSLKPMVRAIADGIGTRLDKPFAFFGHSMGALISLELARLLRRENGLEPIHLFVSGHRAPHIPYPSAPTFDLPEAEFIEELRRLNGTPKEVLANPELMQMMMPLLRADFAVSQTYEYSPEPPLNCPITAFGGVTDEVTREQLEPWREQTTSAFTLKMLPGDHFFIHTAEQHILETINRQLLQYARLVY